MTLLICGVAGLMSQPETPDQDTAASQERETSVNENKENKQEQPEHVLTAIEWLERQYTRIDRQFGSKRENSDENAPEVTQDEEHKRGE